VGAAWESKLSPHGQHHNTAKMLGTGCPERQEALESKKITAIYLAIIKKCNRYAKTIQKGVRVGPARDDYWCLVRTAGECMEGVKQGKDEIETGEP